MNPTPKDSKLQSEVMPDDCYPDFWIDALRSSPYLPNELTDNQVTKWAIRLAAFNSLSSVGSNAMRKKFNQPIKEED